MTEYISFRPDPYALVADAFSHACTDKLFYIFPPYSLMAKVLQKMLQDLTEAEVIAPLCTLHSPIVMGIASSHDRWSLPTTSEATGHSKFTIPNKTKASTSENAPFSPIREALQRQNIPREAQEVIFTSWRDSTKKQYNCYIQQWLLFCGQFSNPSNPTVNHSSALLVALHKKGLKYNAFQTVRAAINNFVQICGGTDFSSHYLIKR